MPMRTDQQGQILAALCATPLDRVRLMKTLFLAWYRMGRQPDAAFQFKPYLYGPYSFELYSVLDEMTAMGLVVQAPHPVERWGNYHLSAVGRKAAQADESVSNTAKAIIAEIAKWARAQSFNALLRQVYREAPEFATQSVVESALPTT